MSLRKTLVTLCIASAIALALALGARPAWQTYKSWRPASLLAEAARFEAEEAWMVAFQKTQAAHLLDREAPGVARQLARLAARVGHPRAMDFWELVATGEGADAGDFAAAIDAALAARRLDRVNAWLDLWRQRDPGPGTLDRRRIEATLLAARGELAASRRTLADLRRDFPDRVPPSVSVLEARVTLSLDPVTGPARAGALLLEAGASPDAEGMQALMLAAGSATLPVDIRLEATRRILAHPAAQLAHRVQARLIESGLGRPVDKELTQLGADLVDSPASTERDQALRAFLGASKGPLLLERLTLDKARGSRELLAAHIEAGLQAGRAREVLELTAESHGAALSASAGLVYRARAFAQLGDTENARDSLAKAVEVAADDDLDLLERSIRAARDPQLLLDYLERLVEHPRAGPLARASAAIAAFEKGDDERMDRHLAAVDPTALAAAPDIQYQTLYLMTLRKVRLLETVRHAENFYAATGGARPARVLLAFANARAGRLDTARGLIETIEAHADAPVHEAVMLGFIREAGADSPVLARRSEFKSIERELFRETR